MLHNLQKLDNIVNMFHMNNALCIGDIMLDEYISGSADRISPEAPVPVIRCTNTRQVLGGVGNLAANLNALGCQTAVFYAIGKDSDGEQINKMLSEKGIITYPFQTNNITTKKQRIIAQKQQICRIDHEEPLSLTRQQEDKIIHHITSLMPKYNIIFLSDYNKGLITPYVAENIIKQANTMHKNIFVDPKGTNYHKYNKATLVKPNFNEFKTAIKHNLPTETGNIDTLNTESVKTMAEKLRQKLKLEKIVVTLGEQGMVGIENNKAIYRPTTAHSVSDVSGAGDTSLAVLGASLGTGTSLENAIDLANIAAGIVVGKEGTAILSSTELKKTLNDMFHTQPTTFWWNNKQNA